MGVDASVNFRIGQLLEASASLGAGLEGVQHDVRALRQDLNAKRARVPVDVRFIASGVVPAGGPRVSLTLGGPEAGFYWLVRRIVVGGLTFKTAALGTAEIYVTGLAGPQGQMTASGPTTAVGLSDLVDQYASLPHVTTYSNEQMPVQEGENLVVLLDSATAAQQYVAVCQIRQFRRTTSEISSEG